MKSIGIGEIQKNTSVLTRLTTPIEVVDKRKRELVAIIYPVEKSTVVKRLAGKYKGRVQAGADFETARTVGMMKAMEEKYGSSR